MEHAGPECTMKEKSSLYTSLTGGESSLSVQKQLSEIKYVFLPKIYESLFKDSKSH